MTTTVTKSNTVNRMHMMAWGDLKSFPDRVATARDGLIEAVADLRDMQVSYGGRADNADAQVADATFRNVAEKCGALLLAILEDAERNGVVVDCCRDFSSGFSDAVNDVCELRVEA